MEKIICKIDGMSCNMCEAHVNDIIRKSFKIKKVKSSHKKGNSEIITDHSISDEKLKDIIAASGYHVLWIKRESYKKRGFLNR